MDKIGALFYLLLMVIGGNSAGRDALDALPTETYWKGKGITPSVEVYKGVLATAAPATLDQDVQALGSDDFKTREGAKKRLEAGGAQAAEKLRDLNSKDPEVQQMAAAMAAKYLNGESSRVQRLMAIRGLGESKERSAVEVLRPLLGSKEPFVAVYAARALAQIGGKAWVPTDHSKEVAGDLALLHKDATAVGQFLPLGLEPMSIEKVAEYAAASGERRGSSLTQEEEMKRLLACLEQVGDFRVDGVTVGVNLEGPQGWTEVVVHGEFDGRRVAELVSGEPVGKVAGVDGVMLGKEGALLLPSEGRLVAVIPFGGNANLEAVAGALQPGSAEGLGHNAGLQGEIQKADKSGPAWAVGRVTEVMRKVPVFAGVDVVRLASKPAAGGKVAFAFEGEGSDAEKMKAAAEAVNEGAAAAAKSMEQEATRLTWEQPGLRPLADLTASMHATTEGTKGTLKGEAPVEVSQMFMMGTGALTAELQRQQERAGATSQP